jgi:hypothetical protein
MVIKTDDIAFSGNTLVLNDKKLDIQTLKKSVSIGSHKVFEEKKQADDEETLKCILTLDYCAERFLTIKCEYGSPKPRNPEVVNVFTHDRIPNPRSSEEVEPKEIFALIDFKTSYLWISYSQKKSVILDFLEKQLGDGSELVSQDVFNEESFIKTLKSLDNIKFSAEPDLLSQTGHLSKILTEDILGFGADIATVEFKYKQKQNNLSLKESIVNKIKSLFESKNTLKNIVISGRDEKNLGMLFNKNVFSKKIGFKTSVDENGMFDSEEIFRKIIENLSS